MKKAIAFLLTATLTFGVCTPASAQTRVAVPKLGKNTVEEVVAAMTLREKAAILSGSYKEEEDTPDENGQKTAMPSGAGSVVGYTQGISRYGIPSVSLTDGPAGINMQPVVSQGSTVYPTSYPCTAALASTWDTELLETLGKSYGQQMTAFQKDILLAPMLNHMRNPLFGRNFECFSEDPLVSGILAGAFINGVQSQGIGVTAKTLIANDQETNRLDANSIVEERALREIYLRSFDILLQNSNPWSIMSTYGKLNGEYTANNKDLLTHVLREEWGYDGAVMTDWGQNGSFFGAVRAQNDLTMPMANVDSLVESVQRGEVSEAQLDVCVKNVLNLVLKTQRFAEYKANNYQPNAGEKPVNPDSQGAATLSRQAAAEAMVLLKNQDSTLPLKEGDKVALFGANQINPIKGGGGSGNVFSRDPVSLQKGFDNASIPLDSSVRALYTGANEPVITQQQADAAAQTSSIAVLAIGREAREGEDMTLQKGSYYLTDEEENLLSVVSDAFHRQNKKVVVVLNTGNLIDLNLIGQTADSILLAWYPGQEMGDAMVDVLSGKVNPSGKLTATAAAQYEDYPFAEDYPGQNDDVPYEEGLYVGYRYFTSFEKQPAYEFGFGLSYTRFTYGDVTLNKNRYDGSVTASVKVTNTGDRAGREVVQLYVEMPEGDLEQPVLQLKGFAKTGLLEPGQSQVISVDMDDEILKSYNPKTAQWILEPGVYTVKAGASCLDIRSQATFEVPALRLVQQVENRMEPEDPIETLTRHDEVTALTETGNAGQQLTGLRIKLSSSIDPASLKGANLTLSLTLDGQPYSCTVGELSCDGRYLHIALSASVPLYEEGKRKQLRVLVQGELTDLSGQPLSIPDTSGREPLFYDSVLSDLSTYDYHAPSGEVLAARTFVPDPPENPVDLVTKTHLIVVLSGMAGQDNFSQVAGNGLTAAVLGQNKTNSGSQAAILAPQLPEGQQWESPAMVKMLHDCIAQFLKDFPHIDPYRISLLCDQNAALGAVALGEAYPGLLSGILSPTTLTVSQVKTGNYQTTPTDEELKWLRSCESVGLFVSSQTPTDILAKDRISAAGNALTKCNFTGGYCVGHMLARGVLNYKILVEADGVYDFRFHVATATGGLGDAFSLLVDGKQVGITYVPASSGWDRYNRTDILGVSLSQGPHDIQILANTDGWNIERMVITEQNAVKGNEVYQGSSLRISCLYNSMNYGMPLENTQEGQGYSFAWVGPNCFVKYQINVIDEGYYDIHNRITSETGVAQGIEVRVDGVTQGFADVPKTGSWGFERNATISDVYLKSGLHEIEFIARYSGFNMGDLVVTDSLLDSWQYVPAASLLKRGEVSGQWTEQELQRTEPEYPHVGATLVSGRQGELTLWFPAGIRGLSVDMARIAAAQDAYEILWSEDGKTYFKADLDVAAHTHRDFSGFFSGTIPVKGISQNAQYIKISAREEILSTPALGGLYVKMEDPVENTRLLIEAIGQVTISSGSKIDAAKTAYDCLTQEQRLQVTNSARLFNAVQEYRQAKLGDINDDNILDALDVIAIRAALLYHGKPGLYGDANDDGELNILDLVATKRKIAGL